jgi:periplasmic divalent cation tolerance protein
MIAETQKLLACVVLVTCGNVEEAETIAKTIVTERLAACVNVVGRSEGMQSFFIWDNLLQKENEILLIIKTMPERLPQLENRIHELHSYSVPEFIVLPVILGGQSYMQWIRDSVSQG